MLVHFPTPYPDELLYSMFSRYHIRSGNISPKQTIEELFGVRTKRAVTDLPANLETLVQQFPHQAFTVDEIISNHTLFPYYEPFLPPERARKIRETMTSDDGDKIHTRAGIAASAIKLDPYLKYCPSCCREDKNEFGELYWHRIHQIPGVLVCPNHGDVLRNSTISIKMTNQHEFMIASEINCDIGENRELFDEKVWKELFQFSKTCKCLLDSNFTSKDGEHYRKHYLEKLKSKGLASTKGTVNMYGWMNYLSGRFEKQTLSLLQSHIEDNDHNWTKNIVRKHRKCFHPIRHLLVMTAFDEDVKAFMEEVVEFQPFGTGPWMCLNVAASHYQKPVVKDLRVTRCYDAKLPVGTFTCSCGFVYSRRGPDQKESDSYKIGRIKSFGKVWDERLKELLMKKGSMQSVAERLNVDPLTVKRQATILGLDFCWGGETREEAIKKKRFSYVNEETDGEVECYAYRNEWLRLQSQYPSCSKTELRRLEPKIYSWLYRQDRKWLNENSPEKVQIPVVNNRVNWKERDLELLAKVKEVVESWDNEGTKPIRITPSAVAKRLNIISLIQKKAELLPITNAYLDKVTESVSKYQIRRVRWVAEQFNQRGEEIMEWKLYREAGLRYTVDNEVKREITLIVNRKIYS